MGPPTFAENEGPQLLAGEKDYYVLPFSVGLNGSDRNSLTYIWVEHPAIRNQAFNFPVEATIVEIKHLMDLMEINGLSVHCMDIPGGPERNTCCSHSRSFNNLYTV